MSLLLDARGVEQRFGGVQALRQVDLAVAEGEIVGLVGPNGSGKSTLINVLSGQQRPTGGEIRLAGTRIDGAAPHRITRAGLARTFQIPRPFPTLSVRDNVAAASMYGRERRSPAAGRRDADEFLAFTGLTKVAGSFPGAVNLHERKFLELARALATRPRVLLLDEVMAGLNPAEVDASVAMVRRIAASGVTLVVVEHLMRVVTQLATRIVVLAQGQVLAAGPPQEVLREPAVVEAYLGRSGHA